MRKHACVLAFPALLAVALGAPAQAEAVTVTGCLAAGHEDGEFQLTHASGGDEKEYELIPGEGIDLGAHVGHKVEVEGAPASEAEEKGGEDGEEEKEGEHAHLRVTSLKHVAATCP